MATELNQSSLVIVTSRAFQHGMEDGVSCYC